MSLLAKVKYFLIMLLIATGTTTAIATQDVETASEALKYLRNILSDPSFVEELHDITSQGYIWREEVIWLGAPKKLEELNNRDAFRKGGVDIMFENSAGEKKWLKFIFFSNNHNHFIKDLQQK